jgi:hypothetical protein
MIAGTFEIAQLESEEGIQLLLAVVIAENWYNSVGLVDR